MNIQKKSNFKIKKGIAVLLSILLLLSIAFIFVGCDSDTPKITMSIYFDNEDGNANNDTYELTYRLNRKYYPQTTKHYLALIESGFYNGTIIHDYQADNNRMIAGAFASTADVQNENFKLQPTVTPASVWADPQKTQVVQNVLYGETVSNGFEIRNGGFSNEKGALGTYTYLYGQEGVDKNPDFTRYVYANASHNKKETREVHYMHNTVTTMFYFSTADTALDSNYTVFAVLDGNKSKNRFNDLMTAIEKARTDMGTAFSTLENLTIRDAFTGRNYPARSKLNTENGGYSNGVFLPKRTITIQSIRIKNY